MFMLRHTHPTLASMCSPNTLNIFMLEDRSSLTAQSYDVYSEVTFTMFNGGNSKVNIDKISAILFH